MSEERRLGQRDLPVGAQLGTTIRRSQNIANLEAARSPFAQSWPSTIASSGITGRGEPASHARRRPGDHPLRQPP